MEYFPEGYEELKIMRNYIGLSKLPEGEHRFRIVQRPVAGWVDWKNNKPYRYRPVDRPEASFDPAKPMKPFWACYVWDYSRGALFVMEITQSTILTALTQFGKDEEWGDFTKYDIKINKTGSGKETKYHVSPVPPKEMKEEVLEALKLSLQLSPVNLNALYEGGDPWGDIIPQKVEALGGITQDQATYLDKLIGSDKGLRDNIISFLKSQGFGETLISMPPSMYEKMVARALKNKQEREEEEGRQRKEMAPTISSIDEIFDTKEVLDEAVPF